MRSPPARHSSSMLSSFDILTVTPRTVPNPLISILVPLYNEEEWIGALLERVLAAPLPEGLAREIVVVDDGSTDGSEKVVEEIAAEYPGMIRLLRQNRNRGKG